MVVEPPPPNQQACMCDDEDIHNWLPDTKNTALFLCDLTEL